MTGRQLVKTHRRKKKKRKQSVALQLIGIQFGSFAIVHFAALQSGHNELLFQPRCSISAKVIDEPQRNY